MAANARILVVEDDDVLRRSLEIAFRAARYEVVTTGDGHGVDAVVAGFRPDLAVLDVRLPRGPDGYEVARTLRRASDLPILFLTAAQGLRARLDGFEAGGDDYLVKPYELDELLARVKALLRRSGRLKSATFQVADLVVDQSAGTVMRHGKTLRLTRTEYALLGVLIEHPGQVLSKAQLLRRVWGFDACDENVVEVHMSSLRRKLEAHGPRLVHTVRSLGYVLRP